MNDIIFLIISQDGLSRKTPALFILQKEAKAVGVRES
jgi:hypothetical protein